MSQEVLMAASRKKKGSTTLRNVVGGAVGSDALLDLVEKLGLVDLFVGRLKARLEETDVDELFEDLTDYMKRNPEVLVVSLGALTVATGLVVFLNSRREWDGTERRGIAATAPAARTTSSTGRVKRVSRVS